MDTEEMSTATSQQAQRASFTDVETTWRMLFGDLRSYEGVLTRTYMIGGTGDFSRPKVALITSETAFMDLVREAEESSATTYIGINPRRKSAITLPSNRWFPRKRFPWNPCKAVTRRSFVLLRFTAHWHCSRTFATEQETAAHYDDMAALIGRFLNGPMALAEGGNGIQIYARVDLPSCLETTVRFKLWFWSLINASRNGHPWKAACPTPAQTVPVVGLLDRRLKEEDGRPPRASHWLKAPFPLPFNAGIHTAVFRCPQEQKTLEDERRRKLWTCPSPVDGRRRLREGCDALSCRWIVEPGA